MERKTTKKMMVIAFVAVMVMMVFAGVAPASADEIVPDDNTVLLDHFNGTTLADYTGGELTFVDSLPTLGQAANFTEGTYLRYDLPGWYTWSPTYDPTGKEGTIELWVKPRRYDTTIVTFQWLKAYTPPEYGYIARFGLDSDGRLHYYAWCSISGAPTPDTSITGATTIPLNQWTHIAVSWGPAGTKIYVNGKVDNSTGYCWYPALDPDLYVYVNGWGKGDLGAIDELHISKIQRTDEEIWSHYLIEAPRVSVSTDTFKYSPSDTMTISIDIANPTEDSVTFQWYWVVPQFSVCVPVMSAPIPTGYDDTLDFNFTIPDWGSTPFGNVFYVQLLGAGSEVLDADAACWAYSPSGEAMSEEKVDIAKEIKKTTEMIE